jgi:hypothetical protein
MRIQNLHPVFRKPDLWISLALFGVFFGIYESMAPTELSLANFGADGGDYLAAVLTDGVPHPSGYPLYLLFSSLAQAIPWGSPVWKEVQISVLAGGLCISLLYRLIRKVQGNSSGWKRQITAAFSAICFGLTPLFWSQAVIVEVYALNCIFILLLLLWVETVLKTDRIFWEQHWKRLILLAWLTGLGLGNHTTLLLAYPLAVWGLFRMSRVKASRWLIILCAFGFISGLPLYMILPLRAAGHPPVNWGDASTAAGFWWLVSGGGYRQNLFAINPVEILPRLAALASLLIQQFGIPALLVAVYGITRENISASIKYAIFYLAAVYAIFALGYRTDDSLVYLLPTLVAITLLLSAGLEELIDWKYRNMPAGGIILLVLAIVLMIDLPARFARVNPRDASLARSTAETLRNLPPNAEYHPRGDGETFALWYEVYGMGNRPDVKIIADGLLQYPWYEKNLRRLYPELDIGK